VRLIVWSRSSLNLASLPPGAESETTVPNWRDRLICPEYANCADRYSGERNRAAVAPRTNTPLSSWPTRARSTARVPFLWRRRPGWRWFRWRARQLGADAAQHPTESTDHSRSPVQQGEKRSRFLVGHVELQAGRDRRSKCSARRSKLAASFNNSRRATTKRHCRAASRSLPAISR
jgi:hypothetical protein